MRWFKQSPVGIFGDVLLLAWAAPRLLEWALEFPFVRVGLRMANLGQAVDFFVQHWENPGWLGNQWVQLAIVIVGFVFLFWDRKRPSWLPSPELNPRQMIIGGLALIVLGTVVVGIGWWRISTTAAASQAAPDKLTQEQLDPTVAALRSRIAELERQVAGPNQLAAKDPYQPGPIVNRHYTANEKSRMIDGLVAVTEVALQIQQQMSLPRQYAIFTDPANSMANRGINLSGTLRAQGYDGEIKVLSTFRDDIDRFGQALVGAVDTVPAYYRDDLNRIIGQTGLSNLRQAADTYIRVLTELQTNNIPSDNVIAVRVIVEPAKMLGAAITDHLRWRQSFVADRSPKARAAIEESAQ